MRRFEDSGVDSYTANRYRGQHGQISFITGSSTAEETKQQQLYDHSASAALPPAAPTSPTASSSSSSFGLAPVQDFQRRGQRSSPNAETIEVDISRSAAVMPYSQQQQAPRYVSFPPIASASSSLPPAASASAAGYSVEGLVALLYDLRSSLSAEQEARKGLELQVLELRQSAKGDWHEVRREVGRVTEELRGGEGRWLQLSSRMKELEVQASVDGRLLDGREKLDDRQHSAQQAAMQSAVQQLQQMMEDGSRRQRDDLDSLAAAQQRAVAAVREQQADAAQAVEERLASQTEIVSQRLELLAQRVEGSTASREELAALTSRLGGMEGMLAAVELAVRETRDLGKREGEGQAAKGDWLRTLLLEQMQAQGKVVDGKFETVEEARKLMLAAVQRDVAAVREEADRRWREAQQQAAAAADREREQREEMESRLQSAVKHAYSTLSSMIKDTVASVTTRLDGDEAGSGSSSLSLSSLSSSLSSLSSSQAELSSVLRAEIKTRMKSHNKTKARIDLLSSQLAEVKAMLGSDEGDLRKLAEGMREEGRRMEKVRDRIREMKARADEEMEKERAARAEVDRRLQQLEDVKRRVDSLDEMRHRVEGVEADRKRVDALEADRQRLAQAEEATRREVEELKRRLPAVDRLTESLERLQRDEREREVKEREREAKEADRREASSRSSVEHLAALDGKVEAAGRERQRLDDRLRELERGVKDDERRLDAAAQAAQRGGRDEETRKELEGWRRQSRDEQQELTRRLERVEAKETAEHTAVEAASRELQRVRDELRAAELRERKRQDELQSQLAHLRDARGPPAEQDTASRQPRSTDAEEREEEEMLAAALETRHVLDDMVAVIDDRQREQALDALRLHLSAQLQQAEMRISACEQEVRAARDGGAARTEPLTGLQDWKDALSAVKRSMREQEDDAGVWRQQQSEQLTQLQQQLREAKAAREQDRQAQAQRAGDDSGPVSGVEVAALREGLLDARRRVEELEAEGGKRDEYGEEMRRMIFQQLTAAEVQISRVEKEWRHFTLQHGRHREDSLSSAPSTARIAVGGQAGEELQAMAGLQEGMTAQLVDLATLIHELEHKHAELAHRVAAGASSQPSQQATAQGSSSGSQTAAEPALAVQLQQLAVRLQEQQTQLDVLMSAGVNREPQQPQREQEVWKRELQLSVAGLKDQLAALQQRAAASSSQGSRPAPAFSDSDSVMLASLTSRQPDSSRQQTQMDSMEQRLREITQQLREQQLTAAVRPASSLAAEIPAAQPPRSGSVRASLSSTSQPNSAVAALAQSSSVQIGELSSRISQIAVRQAEMEARLAAAAAASARSASPSTSPPVSSRSSELRGEVQLLQQTVSAQVSELGAKIARQQEAMEAWKRAVEQEWQRAQQQPPAAASAQQAVAEGRAETAPASQRTSPEMDAAAASVDSRLLQLSQSVSAQVDDLSFRFLSQQEALQQQVNAQLQEMQSELRSAEAALLHIREELTALRSTNASSAAVVAATAAPSVAESSVVADAAQQAALESRLQSLHQQLEAQVGELSWKVNELSARLGQHPQQPAASQAADASGSRPSTGSIPRTVSAAMQSAVDAVQSSFQQSLDAAVGRLSTRVDQLAATQQQQQPAVAGAVTLSSPRLAPPAAAAAMGALASPSMTALSLRLSSTDSRLSTLVAQVQQLESSAAALRASEEAEMADIVSRISGIYKRSKEELASVDVRMREAAARLSAMEEKLEGEVKSGMAEMEREVKDMFHAQDAQLMQVDAAVGEELRVVMDGLTRVEGEGKGERLLMQRRLREMEHLLSKLHNKVLGRPLPSPEDAPDSQRTPRTERWRLRSIAPGAAEPAEQPRLSFLSAGAGAAAAPAAAADAEGRSAAVGALHAREGGDALAAAAARPESELDELIPHHPAHVSIDYSAAHPPPPSSSLSTLDSDELIYDPPSPTATSPPPSSQPGGALPAARASVSSIASSSASFSSSSSSAAASPPPGQVADSAARKPSSRAVGKAVAPDSSTAGRQAAEGAAAPLLLSGLAVTGSRVAGAVPALEWAEQSRQSPAQAQTGGDGGRHRAARRA